MLIKWNHIIISYYLVFIKPFNAADVNTHLFRLSPGLITYIFIWIRCGWFECHVTAVKGFIFPKDVEPIWFLGEQRSAEGGGGEGLGGGETVRMQPCKTTSLS